ncbi:MAG TPA: tRNA 2-thiouridine(34) synthase MnmA [Firmicutes bacterium]|nr:tRNA 2-thiouridine(34) synthase MnmA [Bacillota bacterium]
MDHFKMPGLKPGEKIMVAMSGGLDSSVVALLLKENGFEPVGVTLSLWADPFAKDNAAKKNPGYSPFDTVEEAGMVANDLDMPLHILNAQDEFCERVVSYFAGEYLEGKTPNPCIVCNRHLKFSLLLEKARAMGINYLATGHYARIEYEPEENTYRLFRGVDRKKDQSYMLCMLNQEQLAGILFPLGNYTKEEVRAIAKSRGLRTAERTESQEICFLPDNDYRGFLEREYPQALTPGNILSTSGEKLGEHRGVAFYTVGQRKGLGLASQLPLYVVKIDAKNNVLVVGNEEETYSESLVAGGLNYISGKPPLFPLDVKVKIRYRSPLVPAVLRSSGDGFATVVFRERQKAVTPGQFAVFYCGEEVLGGGTIVSTGDDTVG